MAITLVQSKTAQSDTGNSISATFSSLVTIGNAIVVAVTQQSPGSQTVMIGDDQSNTYFNAGNAKTSPPSIGASAFACFNVQQNAAIKVTASVGSSSFLGLCIAEFSGTYGTNSGAGIDGVGTSFGNSSAPTSGNLATTQDNLLYLGVVTANADGFVVTEESGWTRLCSLTGRMSVGSPISVEYRTAIAGTYAAMWTSGATVLWTAGLFTFLPSASAPLSPQPLVIGQAVKRAATW